ncbi:hypothetical protein RPHASCH2410_CH20955 [Rhizobium phaseoli Ch24-10]|nr:hypothetical protein RPHASCH2410_CH20955 [Rhizobium phaseoli Ch24-10]
MGLSCQAGLLTWRHPSAAAFPAKASGMVKRRASALQRWARSGLAPDSRFSRLTGGHLTEHLFQESASRASAGSRAWRGHDEVAIGFLAPPVHRQRLVATTLANALEKLARRPIAARRALFQAADSA